MLRAAAATSKIIAVYHFIYTFMARQCVEAERQRQDNMKKNKRNFNAVVMLLPAIL
jgi:hypothetical protein